MSKKSTNADWFDYFMCFVFADIISAGLVNLNFFPLTLGLVGYIIYEKVRKEQTDASRLH